MDIIDLSALEIARLVKSKELKTREVAEAFLSHINLVDGVPGRLSGDSFAESDKVHAFINLTSERALDQAEEVDRKIASGEAVGPLAGVPITVKDIFCIEGTPSTAASKILTNFIAPYSATPVERLEAAGAVILGKVNLDEFTYGSSSESSAFQPAPRNPWNTDRVPGGSSGGSTAAVAAREGVLSLGTDTAGSIRQPAAFCGVVGMKPTYGRVSRFGLIAFGSSLDCPGPVARSVTDAALMLGVIAGSDPRDSTSVTVPVPDYLSGIDLGVKGMRVGLSSDYFKITYLEAGSGEIREQSVPEEIRSAVMQAAEVLSKRGAEIVENIPMPHTRYGIPAYFVISRVEAASNLHRFDGVKYGYRTPDQVDTLNEMYKKSRGQGFGVQPKLRILMGMYVSAAQYSEQYYNRALKVRSLIRRDFESAFDQSGKYRVHALLTPTTPTTAFKMGGVYGDSVLMQYADQLTVPGNHAGIPGISIPAGFDADGLPIGIQLLGPDFSEERLLQICRAYESATESAPWRSAKPVVLASKK